MDDIRVIAAIEALKAAVLAVNGDDEVLSTIVLVDLKTADGQGFIGQRFDICPCDKCLLRISKMLKIGLTDTRKNRQRSDGPPVHLR